MSSIHNQWTNFSPGNWTAFVCSTVFPPFWSLELKFYFSKFNLLWCTVEQFSEKYKCSAQIVEFIPNPRKIPLFGKDQMIKNGLKRYRKPLLFLVLVLTNKQKLCILWESVHVFFSNEVFSNEIFSKNTFINTNYFQTVLKPEIFSTSNKICTIFTGLILSTKNVLLSNDMFCFFQPLN